MSGVAARSYRSLWEMRFIASCRAKGMGCCSALDGVLDEYIQKKREGRIYVHQGIDAANQHGFMVPFGT